MKLADLSLEFPREDVHWRVQGTPYERNGKHSAMALAYIDARDVMDRLDGVCGPENWQDEYTVSPTGLTICRIGIRVGDQWVWKSDGAGETAVEKQKGGISDALKRAAVHWGIGRYLYRLDSPWVQCEVNQKNGKTYWKKWSEDPWSKVKNMPYQAAEVEREKEPPFNAPAERDRLKTAISNMPDYETLQRFWGQANVKEVFNQLPEPMQNEVTADFNGKSTALAPSDMAAE